MERYPKRVAKLIREYAWKAHEEELRPALDPLAGQFDAWRAGAVSSGELSDAIHAFYRGPRREIFKFYSEPAPLDSAVASAIARGVLDEGKLDPTVLQALAPLVKAYRERS